MVVTSIGSCGFTKKTGDNKPVSNTISFADNNVVAHRGAAKKNNLPENSIASLKEAIRLNCTGSEFDVRMTADDSLIINHDPHFNQLIIENSNFADLAAFKLSNGERLPTLREYILAGLKNNTATRLFCEIKPSEISKERGKEIAGNVVSLIHELNAQHMMVYLSFDYDILLEILRIDPMAKAMYLNGDRTPEQLKKDNLSGAAYHYSVFKKNEDWIKRSRDLGLQVYVWTVNDSLIMDWLLAENVDFIATNKPETLFARIQQSPVSQGWRLVWGDEFNYSGLPDSLRWNYDVGGHGWGNYEDQFYLANSIENTYVKDGNLHITALKKDHEHLHYTSARLTTFQRFHMQYGKIETSVKLPRGKGTWAAIWMLPESFRLNKEHWPSCGEIDIMEHVGKDPNVIHASMHTELYNHMRRTQITHFDTFPNVFDNFMKYGLEWTEESLKFYINDELFYEYIKGQDGRDTTNAGWPFDKPYYLIFNIAIGGTWGGEIDNTIFPATMVVDYVRVFQK